MDTPRNAEAVTLRAHARLNFGQPQAGVFQMAYVVPDIEVGMRQWIDQLGVGPWFLHPRFADPPLMLTGERPMTGSCARVTIFVPSPAASASGSP
jgi:hypothetical protein